MKKIITLIFISAMIALGAESNAQVLMQKKHHQKVISNSAKKSKKSIKPTLTSSTQVPTKIATFAWDSTIVDWTKEYESVVTYNSKGLPTQELMFDLNGKEVYRTNSTYDAKDRLIEFISEYKTPNNTWVGNEKYIYQYNADDDLILSEELYFTGSTWEVFYGTKSDITKDINIPGISTGGDSGSSDILGAAYSRLRSAGTANHGSYYSIQEVTSDEMCIAAKGGDWYDGGILVDLHQHTYKPTHEQDTFSSIAEGISTTSTVSHLTGSATSKSGAPHC